VFFLLAFISAFAYSLQSSLLVKQARSMERLSLTFYRMLALSVILSPMLLGVAAHDYQQLVPLFPLLTISGLCGASYVWSQFYVVQFIPVGVATSFNLSLRTLAAFILGWLFLAESLIPMQGLLIVIILLGGVVVASGKNHMPHLNNDTRRGVCVSLISGLLGAISFFTLSIASKQANPFMVGYFWELSIFIGTGGILLLRRVFTGQGLQNISLQAFKNIAKFSSPTLIGTICAAFALKMGSLALFSAIASLSVVFASIFSKILYNEKLKLIQWLGIVISLAGVVALKLYS